MPMVWSTLGWDEGLMWDIVRGPKLDYLEDDWSKALVVRFDELFDY